MRYQSPTFAVFLRLFLVCFLFFQITLPTQAQKLPKVNPNRITLSPEDEGRGRNGRQNNFFFARGTSTDFQNAGFTGQRLRPYLAGNTEALHYLNSYRRQKWLMVAERVTFVGAVALYGQQILARDEQQYFNSTQQVAIGVAAASLISHVFITRHTNQHMQRAVDEYNTSLPKTLGNRLQHLAPTTVGVTAPTGRPQLALRWQLH